MNAQACRNALTLDKVDRDKGEHTGLLLSRYLQIPVQDESRKHPPERLALFKAAIAALEAAGCIYRVAYDRRIRFLQQARPYEHALFAVEGRLIVGLGVENVLETGITLHHTYGVPIIPGSALKGLASHYCHHVWGEVDPGFRAAEVPAKGQTRKISYSHGEHHAVIFGTHEDSGHITFHDAWIEPDTLKNSLILDVVTPHHVDYYAEKINEQTNDIIPPTDFDDPKPVTFLSVKGTFHVTIACDVTGDEGENWGRLAFQLLTEALENWGIGGKTSTGYGHLKKEPKPNGPPPRSDSQVVWLKEIRSDGQLIFVNLNGDEIERSNKDVQEVGKKNPLSVGNWYVLTGVKALKPLKK